MSETSGSRGSDFEGRTLARLLGALLRGAAAVAEVLAVATTVLITCEVVTRYLFRQPFGWSVEVSEWALLAMTFLGAGWVLRQDGHVRVDVLVNALGGRTRAIADLAAALVSFAVCALALFYTTKTTFGEYQSGVMTIQLLRFPRFWLLAFIPLGFLFLALEWLRQLLRALEALRHARG